MIEQLGRLISEYGYVIVAVFIFFEGMAIPFPTDTTIVTAAAFAAHGRLSVIAIFLVSTIAATAGTTVAFVAGRRGGTFFDRHSRKVSPAVLRRTRSFFDRHGTIAVLAGRFIPFARMLISPMAGLSAMSFLRFSVVNGIGAAVWAAVFCGVGFFFGQHPPSFGHGIVRATLVVIVALAVLATIAVAGEWLVEESDAAWRAEGTIWHRLLSSAPLRWLAAHSPRARAFLLRRFSPRDYLGLNLTLGLGLSFITLVIFGAVTNALLTHETIPQFDLALASALRETASPDRDAFWMGISRLGMMPIMIIPGLALSLALVRRRGWLPLLGWIGAVVGSGILDLAVKHFFLHPHVFVANAQFSEMIEMGTPSGQALEALVGYGMVAYFMVLLFPNRRITLAMVGLTFVVVLAICFGRLYLGERYFSDVVSGLAAGGVWLSACITGLEVARRRAEREGRGDRGDRRVSGLTV